MHIPDNYLSPATCAVMGAIMVPIWAYSINKVKKEIPKSKIPLLGIGSSLSFLFMMFNVPVPGGTTAHAVGGTLLAILFGPQAATICITVALLVQALLFGDGGILSFGANCFNMAFVIPVSGYFIYKVIKNSLKTEKGSYIGAAIGSYIGINLAAFCAAVEFGIQPYLFKNASGVPMYCPYPLKISIPAMLIPHLTAAGAVEIAVTLGVLVFIKKVSPDIIYKDAEYKIKPIFILMAVLICLSPIGLLAAGSAWGEWGTDEIKNIVGYVPQGMKNGFSFNAFMSDYSVKGLPCAAGYILSAIAATAIFLIVFRIIGSLKRDTSLMKGK